jgi:GNAT superfamily N-acetyltransferase
MPRLSIRKLKDGEMKQAFRLVVNSSNALMKKVNRKPWRIRITAPHPLMMHMKHTDPDGCIGAFENDKMVGFASSTIRENHWYLGYLFVAPGRWSRGIGRKLLTRVRATADPHEVDLFSLTTFSYNPQAVALYTSSGMPPYCPIMNVDWKRDSGRKLKLRRPERKLTVRDIDDYEKLGFINKLDKRNRGVTRPEDHKFFIDNDKCKLVSFYDGRKPVGYAVFFKGGWVAPVSAIDPSYLPDMLNGCVRHQLDAECKQIGFNCAGSNGAILQYLLKIGFRIDETLLLMSNRPFGNLLSYLPAHLAIF